MSSLPLSRSVVFAFTLAACSSHSSPSSSPGAATTVAQALPAAGAQGAMANAELGRAAPDFALPDLDGKIVRLSELRGKTVVLEWFNPECPFVRRNHTEGPLKDAASRASGKGVVWLAINSNAAGKQGSGVDANRDGVKRYGMTYPVLLDATGDIGRAYGARTTPNMYVVAPDGTLAYRGAIDNAPDGDPRGGDKVINYVDDALADIAAGRAVAKRESEPYGCSVKYAAK